MNAKQAWKAMTFEGRTPTANIDVTGNWYVSVAAEVGGDGFLGGITGRHSASLDDAVIEAWNVITNLPRDRHLRLPSGRRVRWTGFMFEDCPPTVEGEVAGDESWDHFVTREGRAEAPNDRA